MKGFPYEDIINLVHPEPRRRPRMPMTARAAQFAPFAALTGHEEAIRETARETTQRPALCEEALAELNRRHHLLMQHLAEHPFIRLTFYLPDKKKPGGAVLTHEGRVEAVDEAKRRLLFADGTAVSMDNVLAVDGPLFPPA